MAVLAGLCIAGFVLGQVQTVARDKGRSDFFTNLIQIVVAPPARVVRNSLVYTEDFFKGVRDAHALRRENARLAAELEGMNRYKEVTDRLQGQIDSLRAMNDFAAPPTRTKLYANIIGFAPEQNRMTLDRGSKDGVARYMPVIAAKGLVGIVEVVDPNRCQVLLVTSRAIRISAEIVGEPRIRGVIHGETQTRLSMEPFESSRVSTGSSVITSGLSELIPAGIPIGIVVEAVDDKQFGTTRVFVLPHIQTGEINEVFILK